MKFDTVLAGAIVEFVVLFLIWCVVIGAPIFLLSRLAAYLLEHLQWVG